MSRNRLSCPVCGGPAKRNGTTSAKTQRWRCKTCGFSWTNSKKEETQQAYWFQVFLAWILGPAPLELVAARYHISRRTLQRHFEPFWFIQIPHPQQPERIYDQLFVDGTYFNKNCLLIASTASHVVGWTWGYSESSWLYGQLFDQIGPPLVVTTDGHDGALKAIKQNWPTSKIQRCLVHVQRNVFTYTTKHPQTAAGKALKRLAHQLLKIHTQEEAITWLQQLQNFDATFHDWLNEKTYVADTPKELIPKNKRKNKVFWYTHERQRAAYNLLEKLARNHQLFVYLDPPPGCGPLKRTTNTLEGSFNRGIKSLLENHRGLTSEHQRIASEWYLYTHQDHNTNPISIARQQNWGRDRQAEVITLATQLATQAPNQLYGRLPTHSSDIDTTVDTTLTIRKGTMR